MPNEWMIKTHLKGVVGSKDYFKRLASGGGMKKRYSRYACLNGVSCTGGMRYWRGWFICIFLGSGNDSWRQEMS